MQNQALTNAMRSKALSAYSHQSKESQEEQWILDNLPLVRHIVSKVVSSLPPGVETEDLISAGTIGLVHAAKAFDPGRDAEFRTYAYIRIRGAVLDELRSRSFVSTGARSRIKVIQQAYHDLSHRHGSPPGDETLAQAAGMTVEELYRSLQDARQGLFLSIHGFSDEDSGLNALVPADGAPGPDDNLEHKEQLQNLAAAIMALPDRDRTIVLLYYERDLTMKEIAETLGITESRISQLHAGALFKLAMALGGDDYDA